jgi:hypothetical protein
MPKITDILSRCFGNGRQLPRQAILNYLSASGNDSSRRFLDTWREIPKKDLEQIPIEAVCLKAGVSPLEILGAIILAAKNLKAQESALMAILAHPEVLEATIQSAKDVKFGMADRKTLHEAIGFLPTKQGSNIAINLLGPGSPSRSDEDDDREDDDRAFEMAFPTISGKLEEWSENRRLITDGK